MSPGVAELRCASGRRGHIIGRCGLGRVFGGQSSACYTGGVTQDARQGSVRWEAAWVNGRPVRTFFLEETIPEGERGTEGWGGNIVWPGRGHARSITTAPQWRAGRVPDGPHPSELLCPGTDSVAEGVEGIGGKEQTDGRRYRCL